MEKSTKIILSAIFLVLPLCFCNETADIPTTGRCDILKDIKGDWENEKMKVNICNDPMPDRFGIMLKSSEIKDVYEIQSSSNDNNKFYIDAQYIGSDGEIEKYIVELNKESRTLILTTHGQTYKLIKLIN